MNKPRILVVEDDLAIGNLIATTLETQDYQFHRAKTGRSAMLDTLSYQPDVLLLDLGLPDIGNYPEDPGMVQHADYRNFRAERGRRQGAGARCRRGRLSHEAVFR